MSKLRLIVVLCLTVSVTGCFRSDDIVLACAGVEVTESRKKKLLTDRLNHRQRVVEFSAIRQNISFGEYFQKPKYQVSIGSNFRFSPADITGTGNSLIGKYEHQSMIYEFMLRKDSGVLTAWYQFDNDGELFEVMFEGVCLKTKETIN